jgi:DNA-binding FadR family transcriptional regulator
VDQHGLIMEGTSALIRRPRARTQAAANEIRQLILSGTWASGRLMPPERDLAAQFGVARNTLRRIVRQLEAEGLIESHPGRGSFIRVSPLGDSASRADALAGSLSDSAAADFARSLRVASPADLMEVRVLLEPLVAELAATRATADDIAAIETALKHLINAQSPAAFAHWDAQLRLTIYRAARNAILLAWCEAINIPRSEPGWCRFKERNMTPELRGTCDGEHEEIVAALRNRDPGLARDLMRKHMQRVRDSLLPLA